MKCFCCCSNKKNHPQDTGSVWMCWWKVDIIYPISGQTTFQSIVIVLKKMVPFHLKFAEWAMRGRSYRGHDFPDGKTLGIQGRNPKCEFPSTWASYGKHKQSLMSKCYVRDILLFCLRALKQKKYQNNFCNSTCLKTSNLFHPWNISMDFKWMSLNKAISFLFSTEDRLVRENSRPISC